MKKSQKKPRPVPKTHVIVRRRVQQALQPRAEEPVQRVGELVPAFCAAEPTAPTAGRVRLAFRAHIMWLNEAGFGVVSWQRLSEIVGDDRDRMVLSLCELYSRAYFESMFAAHFDGSDPRSDVMLLKQLADTHGTEMAMEVHRQCADRGVVRQRPLPDTEKN